MKKIFTFLAIICLSLLGTCVMADDVDMPSTGDLWDNWNNSQDFYGQNKKGVSDEEFNKTIDKLKEKQNKGGLFKKRIVPKGEEFSQSNETEVINEQSNKDSLPVVCIPVELAVGDGVLPVGHYQVKGEKNDDGSIVLKFYQAQYLMAQFPAIETTDDFDEDTITFAKWIPEGENKIKVIFGSMDFNAYTIIDLK